MIEQLQKVGTVSCCLSPGVRNSALIAAITQLSPFPYYFWNDERSAAFFALGQARQLGRPAAVCVTSGTAAGELLPATMEAYYNGTPLILITADRPRHYRGSGAPQTAEQPHIYGCYAPFECDVAVGEPVSLEAWERRAPLHLNLCFEEAYLYDYSTIPALCHEAIPAPAPGYALSTMREKLCRFLDEACYPLVLVGTLAEEERDAVARFLERNRLPAYIEAVSGLREAPQLQRFTSPQQLLERDGYPVDAILRLGGVPTLRLWRDLEMASMPLLSASRFPFRGISWAPHLEAPLSDLLAGITLSQLKPHAPITAITEEVTDSEAAIVEMVSQSIPTDALVYLGNSKPIRNWDRIASSAPNKRQIWASRGLSGIDGQLSTFYGLCRDDRENWALLGDLTTLHDMAAPWILPQLPHVCSRLLVINNGGGAIFDRLFGKESPMRNSHTLSLEPMAQMWGMEYCRWDDVANSLDCLGQHCLIEAIPS